MKTIMKAVAFAAALSAGATAVAADWAPNGPIKLLIAFRAGGSVDSQARLIAEELNARHGWEVIPENVPGKGGAVMARELKDQPADGLSIGMSVTDAVLYAPLISDDAGYTADDFSFLTTTASSQLAIFAKASRGWNTLADVIAEAKETGTKFSIGTFSTKHADANYLLGLANDVEFNTVMVKGGKGALNGILADDIDIAWGGGPQAKGVAAGDFVELVSAEDAPLINSPDAPLISEFGVPFSFGAKFIMIAPAGLPDDAQKTLTKAISDILNDPTSKTHQFITQRLNGVVAIAGDELTQLVSDNIAANTAFVAAVDAK